MIIKIKKVPSPSRLMTKRNAKSTTVFILVSGGTRSPLADGWRAYLHYRGSV
jgi:hypothetical protein